MEESNQKLNINLTEEVAEGVYSNLAIITHSSSEFVLDFVRVMPGVQKANVKARIILTPEHAKRLLNALKENVDKYEMEHGRVSTGTKVPVGFNVPKGDA
ncbi:MAG: DUF3467 domain-containing protein [Bacteroidales bacterium]|nr:DUF3467 domain-containing protein [Bacteroidales bacterium]